MRNQHTPTRKTSTDSAKTGRFTPHRNSASRVFVALLGSILLLLTFVPASAAEAPDDDDAPIFSVHQATAVPVVGEDLIAVDTDCAEPGIGKGCGNDDDDDGPGPGNPGCVINCGPDEPKPTDPTSNCKAFGCDGDLADGPPPGCEELIFGCDDDDDDDDDDPDPTSHCEAFGCNDTLAPNDQACKHLINGCPGGGGGDPIPCDDLVEDCDDNDDDGGDDSGDDDDDDSNDGGDDSGDDDGNDNDDDDSTDGGDDNGNDDGDDDNDDDNGGDATGTDEPVKPGLNIDQPRPGNPNFAG